MEELIGKIVAPAIQTLAIVVTAYFASRGLHAWRDQLVGKRRMEVAEEALVATYKVREALNSARTSGSFAGEGGTRQRDPRESEDLARAKDAYFVPVERLQRAADDFAQFQKARVLCQAYFGPSAAAPFDAVMAARWKVVIAARMLLTTADERTPSAGPRQQWQAQIWAGFGGEGTKDRIAEDIDRAVEQIENLCRPHLMARL